MLGDKFIFIVRDIIESRKGDLMTVRVTAQRALRKYHGIGQRSRDGLAGLEISSGFMEAAYEIVAQMCEAYGGVVFTHTFRSNKKDPQPRGRVYKFG
jgi:hypothetical protein